jgi:acetyl-CoA C-acetyltransferase
MFDKSNAPLIVTAVRTAIGSFGGSLKDHAPTALAATCVAETLRRSGAAGNRVGHVVFGNVIHTEPRDMYLARVAAIEGGVGAETPALTLNRLCGSGLQAVISATQSIALGDTDCAIAGGAEVMSRAPHASQNVRWGAKMGDVTFIDMMTGALTDPFGQGHMGVTAENVSKRHQISRQEQDALAVESHRRAERAIAEGRFVNQIVPINVRKGRDSIVFAQDEHVRGDVSLDSLSSLRPVFSKEGTVTAGNASGINDGAAALLLVHPERASKIDLRPLARIVGYAHAGVDPAEMGVGPIPATRRLLERIGLKLSDFDVIESNEAFAAQACAVAKELGFDAQKTNPNGGAIALGHPIGATGAILTVKLVHELQRTKGRFGLVTMCIGGGQGIALAVEAMH